MKIRNGFVSNSSSSSYIIAISHIPTSIEEMKAMTYPSHNMEDSIGDEYYQVIVKEVVYRLFEDIIKSKPLSKKRLIELSEVSCGDRWYTLVNKYNTLIYNYSSFHEYEKRLSYFWGLEESRKFLEQNPNKLFLCLNYDDDEGDNISAFLEHYGPLDKFPHIYINNH